MEVARGGGPIEITTQVFLGGFCVTAEQVARLRAFHSDPGHSPESDYDGALWFKHGVEIFSQCSPRY